MIMGPVWLLRGCERAADGPAGAAVATTARTAAVSIREASADGAATAAAGAAAPGRGAAAAERAAVDGSWVQAVGAAGGGRRHLHGGAGQWQRVWMESGHQVELQCLNSCPLQLSLQVHCNLRRRAAVCTSCCYNCQAFPVVTTARSNC